MDSRRLGRVLALGLAVAGGGAAAAEIVIGQIAPLSGVLASTGQQMVAGGKAYFDHVNAQGGVNGALIRTLVVDDAYKVEQTLTLTREMVARPEVVALFGMAGTANIGQLLQEDVLGKAGIALVAPYTGGEPLRTPFNPWIFHLRAGYADETEHIVKQLVTQGIQRVAVVYQDDAFGQAGLDGAAAAFIKQYREAGGGGQLFSISVVDPAELVKLAGLHNARGLGISQVVPYPYQPTLPVVRQFRDHLARYVPGAAVNYTNFEEYLGAKVLVEGLRRAGPNPTRERLIKALEGMGSWDLGGFSVAYGPKQRVGSRFVDVTVIGGNGKLLK